MNGRQILDIHEGKARVKPMHHQPVPNQYGTWWGHGSEVRVYGLVVGRGENTYFAASAQALLGGTSCWDDRPPKRGKVEGGTVHAIRDRERKHLHHGRKGRHSRLINKTAFLYLELGRGM